MIPPIPTNYSDSIHKNPSSPLQKPSSVEKLTSNQRASSKWKTIKQIALIGTSTITAVGLTYLAWQGFGSSRPPTEYGHLVPICLPEEDRSRSFAPIDTLVNTFVEHAYSITGIAATILGVALARKNCCNEPQETMTHLESSEIEPVIEHVDNIVLLSERTLPLDFGHFTSDKLELPHIELIEPSAVDFNAAKEASTLFALMHLDFMNLDTEGLNTTATVSLPFLIQQLTMLLDDEHLRPEAKEKMQELITSYQFTYTTAHWPKEFAAQKDTLSILAYKKAMKEKILKELTSEKSVTISAGYRAKPAGHEIALQLSLIEENGEMKVQGAVINRGEGNAKHLSDIMGHKEKKQSILTLLPVPIEDLENSSFLECMLDLNFEKVKDLGGLAGIQAHTLYGIDDFYEGLLPQWPKEGKKITFSKDSALAARTPQRGGTCTVKPYLTQLKDVLGDTDGNYCKFQMKLSTLELYLENTSITLANRDLILSSLKQLNRSALKLYKKGMIDQSKLKELSAFSKEIKAEIKTVVKNAKAATSHQLLEFSDLDKNTSHFDIQTGQPFKTNKISKIFNPTQYQIPDLSNCDMATLSEFLTDSCKIIRKLVGGSYMLRSEVQQDGLEYATRVLMAIPSSASPIWEELSARELEELIQIQEVLLDKIKYTRGIKSTSPNEGCLHLKCLVITIKASLKSLDPELIAFILRRIPTYVDRDTLYSGPSSETLAEEANQAYAFLDHFFKDTQPEESVKTKNIRKTSKSESFDQEEFKSLQECMKNPEMRYLINHQQEEYAKRVVELAKKGVKVEEDLEDISLIQSALDLIYFKPNCGSTQGNLTGNSDSIHLVEEVKDFALVKKQYLMMFQAFFLRGSSKASYSKSPKINLCRTYQENKKVQCGITLSEFQSHEKLSNRDSPPKFLDSQGLNPDEILAYSDITTPVNTESQNDSVGTNYQVSGLDIPSHEFRELLSINCKASLTIPQLVHYFEKHIDRFKEGLFRAIFTGALFHRTADSEASNIQNCMKYPLQRKQLFAFFKRASAMAEKTQSFGVQCFLLKTWIQSLTFLAASIKPNSPILLKEINVVKKEIEKLLGSDMASEDRAALTHTLIASYSYIQESPEIRSALSNFCEWAYQEIAENGYDYNFKRQPDDPSDAYERSPQFQEDFEKGKFDLKNNPLFNAEKSILLPDSIANSDVYKSFFASNYKATKLETNLFEFTDHQEQRYRIQINDNQSLSLYLEKPGRGWYQYQQKTPFPFEGTDHPCSSQGVLMQNASCWYQVDGKEVLVLASDQKKVILRVTEQAIQKGEEVEHPLFLATDYTNDTTLTHLSRLTLGKKDQLLLWKTSDGNLCELEIPSLKLSFHKEKMDNGEIRWMSDAHPGYFLDPQAKTWAFEPLNHYVLLKNADAQQIVLIPNYTFENQQPKFASEELPKTKMVSENKLRLFAYALEPNGSIKLPHKVEDLLFLTYISLTKRDYSSAHKVLKKLKQHPTTWSAKASELLSCFDSEDPKQRDDHPHAISLRIELKMLADHSLKNGLTEDQRKILTQEYKAYLNQLNNMGNFLLDREDEISCLELIPTNTLINLRRQELGMGIPFEDNFALEIQSPPAKQEIKSQFQMGWITRDIQEKMVEHCDNPLPLPLKMRLGSDFVQNFLYYYHVASTLDSPNKDELRALLHMGRYTDNDNIQSLRQFLLRVMEHPEDYPAFEEMLEDAENGTLRKKLKDLNENKQVLTTPEEWTFAGSFQNSSLSQYSSLFEYLPVVILAKAGNRLTATAAPAIKQSDSEDPAMEQFFVEDPEKIIDLTSYLTPVDPAVVQQEIDIKNKGLETLKQIFTQEKGLDPCVNSEYHRIFEGIEKKQEEVATLKTEQQTLDLTQLKEVSETLTTEIEGLEGELQDLQKSILTIARDYPHELETEVEAGMLTPLKFSELMLFFGREDDRPLLVANPSLTAENLQQIKGLMREYLLTKRHQQQCMRLHKSVCIIQSLDKNGKKEEAQAECREFIRTYESRPCYTSGNPHLLLFEVMGNILVRQDQYDKLMQMAKGGQHAILEARTGFGKSKVLIPLWLYLTSLKRETVSMMTVPSSLFTQQVAHLKDVLGDAYSQSVLEVHLSREHGNDLNYLKRLNTQLDQAMQKKMCVIADIHTMHHLVNLAFKENFCKKVPNKEVQAELLKIRQTIAEKLSLFIDESRECLDIRHRYDDALGQPKPVDLKYCQTIGKLYEELIVKEANWTFEFLPDTAGKIPLSEKEYDHNMLPLFAEKIAELFNVDEKYKLAILADLQGEYTPACEAFYKTLSPDHLKDYAIYKDQLNLFLRRSLNRNAEEHYGLSKASSHRFAVPYARGKPSETSEFSTLDDLLNFTIQANLKEPFRTQDIQQFVDTLKIIMLQDDGEDDPRIALCNEMLSFLQFSNVDTLMDLKPSHVKAMQEFLNNNPVFKLKFIVDYILPQISLYENKVSSSAYNLLNDIKEILGASGTVNSGIFPEEITILADPTAPLDNLLSMAEHSTNQVYEIPDTNSSHEKLLYILEKYPNYRALIDVDGSFREMTPEDVASTILQKHADVKAVSYYDHAGRNLVLQKGSGKVSIPFEECRLPLEEIFTFFPQSSVVGSDTQVALLTKALVTVNKTTELDLFLQGVGRMRGLQKGQQVGFAVNDSDSQFIQESYGNISLETMLRYMTDRQGVQRGKDQFFALRLMLENQIETYLRENYPDKFKEYITKSTQADPLSKLRENKRMIPAEKAVEQLVVGMTAGLKDVLTDDQIESMNQEFLNTVKYELLPTDISFNQEDEVVASIEVETMGEVSQEASQENEVEQEELSEEMGNTARIDYTPATPIEWSGNYMELMQDFKSLLDENIRVSPNYLRIAKEGKIPLRKPAYQYMISHDPQTNHYEIVLLDLYDGDKVLKAMEEADPKTNTPTGKSYYLYSGNDLIGEDIAGDQTRKLTKEEWATSEQLIKLGIIRKIYEANPYLTKVEKEYLENNIKAPWIADLIREIDKSIKIWPQMAHLKKFFVVKGLCHIKKTASRKTSTPRKSQGIMKWCFWLLTTPIRYF